MAETENSNLPNPARSMPLKVQKTSNIQDQLLLNAEVSASDVLQEFSA
jgi:hypothetical protein